MPTGAITSYIDVAQLTLYAFWIFFIGLIVYLRREDKREGYPLLSERSDRVTVEGMPRAPAPKVFLLPHGGMRAAPRAEVEPAVLAAPLEPWLGAPLEPTGNPMIDGVGTAAWATRGDTPELTFEGEPRIVPLRVATGFSLDPGDPDPRGMTVFGADNRQAGMVTDVWIDRTEPQIRYLEVAVQTATGPRHVLLPIGFARRILGGRRNEVRVGAILAAQFVNVPVLQDPHHITLREEDRVSAYFAGGFLYATPLRREPLL